MCGKNRKRGARVRVYRDRHKSSPGSDSHPSEAPDDPTENPHRPYDDVDFQHTFQSNPSPNCRFTSGKDLTANNRQITYLNAQQIAERPFSKGAAIFVDIP